MGPQNMGRPFDKHLDSDELNTLAPSSSESGQQPKLSQDAVRGAMAHVESCRACRTKLSQYGQLVSRSKMAAKAAPPQVGCPQGNNVDWDEVAAGLWPDLKAEQLIMHAALCDHCGPMLRAATSVCDDPTPEEARFLAQLKVPSQPTRDAKRDQIPTVAGPVPLGRRFLQWKIFVPAVALMVIVGVLSTRPPSPPTPLSGSNFAQFAVNTHRQHDHGNLALDVRSDSQPTLNEWFKAKSQFSVTLPVSASIPGEERFYYLEGARLIPVGAKTAAYIAYQMQTGLVSLIVTPDSVALASGGVEADFKKVSFHYRMVEGYKVVTWSAQGLTYALVSREGNRTQRSCMVCHSAMRDRDLSQTPTPLGADGSVVQPVLQ